MPVSDFFAPYLIGLRHHAFPMRSHRLPDRTTRRPPRSRRGVYVRAWGLRRREVRLRLAMAAHPILPSTMRRASAHSEHISFGAQYPAHTRRYRRFTDTLTGIAARLAVNRGSAHPSFQGLSPLPLRQLAWRTLILIVVPPQPPLWLDRRPPVDPVTWRTAVTHRARARESSRRAETAAPSRETAVLQWCSARPRVGSRGGGELPDRNEAHAGWRAKLPAWGSAAGGRAALRACIHGAPTHQRGPQRAVGSTRFHHACTPCTPPQD